MVKTTVVYICYRLGIGSLDEIWEANPKKSRYFWNTIENGGVFV